MTAHDPPDQPDDELDADIEVELVEAVLIEDADPGSRGLAVHAEPGALQPSRMIAPAQAVAVAATGFLAGAAALALLHRRGGRGIARELTDLRDLRDRYDAARRTAQPQPFGMVPGRSYLIQIRVLGRPPE